MLVQQEVETLKARVTQLEQKQLIRTPITTFAPEPYEIIRPIEVVIEPYEDEYIASFYDANIGTSGDSPEEAFANLKELILDTYDLLLEHDTDALGPEPQRQRAVLSEFVRKQ